MMLLKCLKGNTLRHTTLNMHSFCSKFPFDIWKKYIDKQPGRFCITCLFLFVLVFLPIPIFRFGVSPFRRGFYCGDETISYPYKTDTITTAMLFGVGISLNVIGVSAVSVNFECWIFFFLKFTHENLNIFSEN